MDNKKKSNYQHRIFKLIIIGIVLIFIYLIYYFLKIQLTKSDDIGDYIFEYNRDKYIYFENQDKSFKYTSHPNNFIEDCVFNKSIDFYKSYIMQSKPCIIKNSSAYNQLFQQYDALYKTHKNIIPESLKQKYINSKDYIPKGNITVIPNEIEKLFKEPTFAKYSKASAAYYKTGTKFYESKNFMNQFDHLIMQIKGEVIIRVSPPSQISKLNPYRKNDERKNYWDFNTIYAGKDFFTIDETKRKENEKVLILTAKLNKHDILYIPGFFFVQYRITTDYEFSYMIDYQPNSRVLKNIFKVLFDDNVTDDDYLD